MKTFTKLSLEEAISMSEGNRDGFTDYVSALKPRYDETDTHLDPRYLKGYLAGYRLASRGKAPSMMRVITTPPVVLAA